MQTKLFLLITIVFLFFIITSVSSQCSEQWGSGFNCSIDTNYLTRRWDFENCSYEWRNYTECYYGCTNIDGDVYQCTSNDLFTDYFTRSVLYPWGKFATTNTVDVEDNQLNIENQCPKPSMATYSIQYQNDKILTDFYLQFDWYYGINEVDGYGNPIDVILISWWKDQKKFSIMFDPWHDQINMIKDLPYLTDLTKWENYDPDDLSGWNIVYTIPWEVSWSEGEWHNFEIQRTSDYMTIKTDGDVIFHSSDSVFTWADMGNLGLGLGNPGLSSYPNNVANCRFDNFTVGYNAPPQLSPNLNIIMTGVTDNKVNLNTQFQASCVADQPVTLYLKLNDIEVSNPYGGSFNSTGVNFFYCYNEETEGYTSEEASNWVEVVYIQPGWNGTSPVAYNHTAFYEPIIDRSDLELASLGWTIPFLTPIFWVITGVMVFSGILTGITKSVVVFPICIVIFMLVLGIFQVITWWISGVVIIFGILGLAGILKSQSGL